MRPLRAAVISWNAAILSATLLCWLVSRDERLSMLIAALAFVIVGIAIFPFGVPLYVFRGRKQTVRRHEVIIYFTIWAVGAAALFFVYFMYAMMYCIPLALLAAGLTFVLVVGKNQKTQ